MIHSKKFARIIFLMLVNAVSGCVPNGDKSNSSDIPKDSIEHSTFSSSKESVLLPEDITVEQARTLMAQKPDLVILDVRTPQEFAEGHLLEAVNYNILNNQTLEKIGALEKDKTYLIYCKGGSRSARCQAAMKELGFENTYNMLGGFTA